MTSQPSQCVFYAGFEWTDGSPVEYTNWHDGEPNDYDAAEDCGEMSFNGHGWNDINCMWYQRPAVCMIPKGTYYSGNVVNYSQNSR